MGVFDSCEDMILLAMGGKQYENGDIVHSEIKDGRGGVMVSKDVGSLLSIPDMNPSSMYAFALTEDSDRIFSTSKDDLLQHPADILGESSEVAAIYGGAMKWVGVRRIEKPPMGIYSLRPASCWYEYHFKMFFYNGTNTYHKRIIAFTSKGDVAAVMSRNCNVPVCAINTEGSYATLMASIIEDSHRARTMLASVQDNTELKFAVPLDDYKEMFLGRDSPLKNGRKKAIIHWVASHLRKKPDGCKSSVKKHIRGVSDIVIDGLKISITPNDVQLS